MRPQEIRFYFIRREFSIRECRRIADEEWVLGDGNVRILRNAELAQDNPRQVGESGVLYRDLLIGKEDTRDPLGIDAMVAAPSVGIVAHDTFREIAERTRLRYPVTARVAHDQIGTVFRVIPMVNLVG